MRRNIKRARFWIGNPHLYLEPTVNDYFVVEDELTRGIAIYQRQYPGDLAPYIGEIPTAIFDRCTYYRLAKSNDFREELELEWAEFQYKVEWCHPYRALFSSDIATFTKGADSWFLSEDFTILTRDPDNIDDGNNIVINIPDLPYPKNEPDGLKDTTPTHILTDKAFQEYFDMYVGDELSDQQVLRSNWESALEEAGGNEIKVVFDLGNYPELITEDKYLASDDEILNALRPHVEELVQVVQFVGRTERLNGVEVPIEESTDINDPYLLFHNIYSDSHDDIVSEYLILAIIDISYDEFLEDSSLQKMHYAYARFFKALCKNKKAYINDNYGIYSNGNLFLENTNLPKTYYYKSLPIQNIEIIDSTDDQSTTTKQLVISYLANPNLQTYTLYSPIYNDKQYCLDISNYQISSTLSSLKENFNIRDSVLPHNLDSCIHDISGLFPYILFVNRKQYDNDNSSANEGIWDDSDNPGGEIEKGPNTKGIITKSDIKATPDNAPVIHIPNPLDSIILSTISTTVNVRLRYTKEYSIGEYGDALIYKIFYENNLGIPKIGQLNQSYNKYISAYNKHDIGDIAINQLNIISGITLNAYGNFLTTWQVLVCYGRQFTLLSSDTLKDAFSVKAQANLASLWNETNPNKTMPNISIDYYRGKQMGFKKLAAAKWISDITINLLNADFTDVPFILGDFVFPKSVTNCNHSFYLRWADGTMDTGSGVAPKSSTNSVYTYPGNIDLSNMDDVSEFKNYFGLYSIFGEESINTIGHGINSILLSNSINLNEDAPHWLTSVIKFPKHVNLLLLGDFAMHKLNVANLTFPINKSSASLIMNSIVTDNIVLPEGDYLFRLNGCITNVLNMSKVLVSTYYKTKNFDDSAILDYINPGDITKFANTVTFNWYIDNLRNNVAKQAVYLPKKADSLLDTAGDFFIIQGIIPPIRILENAIKELDYSNLMKGGMFTNYVFIPPIGRPSLKTVNFGNNNKTIRFAVPVNLGGEKESSIENITGNFTLTGFESISNITLLNMPHLSSSTIDLLINSIPDEGTSTITFNSALQSKITDAQLAALTAKGVTVQYASYDEYTPEP